MPYRSLIKEPLWRAEDLGKTIPPTTHGISMCLPRWQDVVGYEEQDPKTMEHLCIGYPRFFYHPLVCRAFNRFAGQAGEHIQIYTTRAAAERCQAYLLKCQPEASIRLRGIRDFSATVVLFPKRCKEAAKAYWQHTGEGISSRYAEALLAKEPFSDTTEPVQQLQQRVADFAGAKPEDVYLFSSGMGAIYCAYRAILQRRPGSPSVQFSFPYGDTLKLQQKLGDQEPWFFPRGDEPELEELERKLARQKVCGLFCEFPTNPLLTCVDLEKLRALADAHDFPLIVDETLGACINQKTLAFSDLTVVSLTKFFSGSCDIMGGALIVNSEARQAKALTKELQLIYEPEAHVPADLERMIEVSEDYRSRVEQINATSLAVCQFLEQHPAVEAVYYPAFTNRERYDAVKQEGGGYGGLFSFVLKNPAEHTPAFYDALEITKGPNLGTSFSLCCPFTLLAHYNELDWAEKAGASRYLIRLSVGLEPALELIARIERALRTAGCGS